MNDEEIAEVLNLPDPEVGFYTKTLYDRMTNPVVTRRHDTYRECEKAYEKIKHDKDAIAVTMFKVTVLAEYL